MARKKLIKVISFFLVFVYFTILFPYFYPQTYALLAILLAIVFIFMSLVFFSENTIKHLSLNSNGTIIFSDSVVWKIHVSSRVGWFGCWLLLTQLDDNTIEKNSRRIFLFSDQCEPQDYARLSRLILKLKRSNGPDVC